jgi:hypothetical protein
LKYGGDEEGVLLLNPIKFFCGFHHHQQDSIPFPDKIICQGRLLIQQGR